MERGIEVATTTVLRQEPRNRRIIAAVNDAAIIASCPTSASAVLTKTY
jgi:hypothetical protein